MQENPTVSIIIITCNDELVIKNAAQTALAQQFSDLELLIVNDGSTDGTKRYVDDIAANDKRVRTIHLTTNRGRSAARATGLNAARGRYIMFLDADDRLPLTSLRYLVQGAESKNADVVIGRLATFDSKSGEWHARHYTDAMLPRSPRVVTLDTAPELVDNNAIVGRLYRAEYLSRHQIRFPETRRCAEDVSFSFFALFHAERVLLQPTISYYYSVGNYLNSATPEKVCDARDALKEIAQFCKASGSDPVRKAIQHKLVSFCLSMQRAERAYPEREDLITYVGSLRILATEIDREILTTLDESVRRVISSLISGDATTTPEAWKATLARENKSKNIEHARHQVYETRAAARELQREIDLKLAELNSLYGSSSWRMSKPFRTAARLIRTCVATLSPNRNV